MNARAIKQTLAVLGMVGLIACTPSPERSASVPAQDITLIHIGDLHGHLLPRPNLRSDGHGVLEGGLARLYTKVQEIRRRDPQALLINTGDTIQGSAEALYTRGAAMLKALEPFHINAYTPGNWDYVYGTTRFLELFAGPHPQAGWNALAANLYYDAPYTTLTGQRVLPAYQIRTLKGVKIALLGLTTDRGPQVVPGTTRGLRFTDGRQEYQELVPRLRQQADVVVVLSEIGLASNVALAHHTPGADVILSSDMHEETPTAIRTAAGTILVEEGQDGTRLGELRLKVENGRVAHAEFTQHIIDARVPEDPGLALRIKTLRAPLVAGNDFRPHQNPINSTWLQRPIDTVIGHTKGGLHRADFSREGMPAVIEGSSHDFLTDAFRSEADADIGLMRGFRYGTHIAPGPIRLEDVYHYIPIGPFIARGKMRGDMLKKMLESGAEGSLSPDLRNWRGGWLAAWSGLRYALVPWERQGARARDIEVYDRTVRSWRPLDPATSYSVASYYYPAEPAKLNGAPAYAIDTLRDAWGEPLDATEVVARYLEDHAADPGPARIRLIDPLPKPKYGNSELQPIAGVAQKQRAQ